MTPLTLWQPECSADRVARRLRSVNHDTRLYFSGAVFHAARDLGCVVVRLPCRGRFHSFIADFSRYLARLAPVPGIANRVEFARRCIFCLRYQHNRRLPERGFLSSWIEDRYLAIVLARQKLGERQAEF